MTVTVTAAKSGRINIFADGEYRFTVPSDIWFSSPFHEGDEVTENELLALKKASGFFFAYESAMRMLGLRAHSKKELTQKLRVKYGEEETLAAVQKCEKYGFINDEAFAREFARELHERKHYAPARIKNELRLRGISSELIENAVSLLEETDETGIEAAAAKIRMKDISDEKEKARVYRRLLSMGYSYSEIAAFLRACDD